MISLEQPEAALLPSGPSLRIAFAWVPSEVAWGATWAVLCGSAAALPWHGGPGDLLRVAAVWFASVPLFGAYWSVPTPGGRPTTGDRERGLALSAAVVIGGMLSTAVALVLITAAVVAALPRIHRLRNGAGDPLPRSTWPLRTCLELVVPATTGWLALGGPRITPPAIAVEAASGDLLGAWLSANVAFLVVVAAFALIHHGATGLRGPADIAARHHEIVVGYLLAVGTLAWAGSTVAALAVAGIFAIQWQYLAMLRAGKVRWHLLSTQYAMMAAMLAAFLGA